MGTLRLNAERELLKMFDEEQGQVGVEAARNLNDNTLIEIGSAFVAKAEKMDTNDLEPSTDLFKTNAYSIYDKTPEQLAVDLQAIKDRIAEKQENAFQKKLAKGEAIRIDLKGKTLEEIDLISKQLDTAAAERREKEQRFSDNPIIATADSLAEIASTPLEYGKKAIALVKDNPGKSLATAATAFSLWQLFKGKDGEGFNFGGLLLVGLATVFGSALMFNEQPETFNRLTESFGLDRFFNKAPADKMLRADFGNSVRGMFGLETATKFGDVSAEAAGSITSADARLPEATAVAVKSWNEQALNGQVTSKARVL